MSKIRQAAEAMKIAATWIEQCPFENAIPHANTLRELAGKLLSEPDAMDEAVEIIRQFVFATGEQYVVTTAQRKSLRKARNFLSKLEAAK
jgi:heterodisulfide reductase subunit C